MKYPTTGKNARVIINKFESAIARKPEANPLGKEA